MTDETAKALADAMNRLAAAIEALPRNIMGIQVQHHGASYPGSGGCGRPPPVYTTTVW
jgi:hypothetical protein